MVVSGAFDVARIRSNRFGRLFFFVRTTKDHTKHQAYHICDRSVINRKYAHLPKPRSTPIPIRPTISRLAYLAWRVPNIASFCQTNRTCAGADTKIHSRGPYETATGWNRASPIRLGALFHMAMKRETQQLTTNITTRVACPTRVRHEFADIYTYLYKTKTRS